MLKNLDPAIFLVLSKRSVAFRDESDIRVTRERKEQSDIA